jgi:hypothetical protein
MTKEELAAKVEWEGGVAEAIIGYGLKLEDLPPDAPTHIRACWKTVQDARFAIEQIANWLEAE